MGGEPSLLVSALTSRPEGFVLGDPNQHGGTAYRLLPGYVAKL